MKDWKEEANRLRCAPLDEDTERQLSAAALCSIAGSLEKIAGAMEKIEETHIKNNWEPPTKLEPK